MEAGFGSEPSFVAFWIASFKICSFPLLWSSLLGFLSNEHVTLAFATEKVGVLAGCCLPTSIQFYEQIGLPKSLEDLGLRDVSLAQLRHAAAIACQPNSDIHRLPFTVSPEQVMAAMVSTTTADTIGQKVKAN